MIPLTINETDTMYWRVASSKFKLFGPDPDKIIVGVMMPPITAKKSFYKITTLTTSFFLFAEFFKMYETKKKDIKKRNIIYVEHPLTKQQVQEYHQRDRKR